MTCPICASLADAGLVQDHPDYENPEMGDQYHGQYDPNGDMSEFDSLIDYPEGES